MDLRLLKKIIKEFEASSLDKLEITEKDFNVKLEKNTFKTSPEINQTSEQVSKEVAIDKTINKPEKHFSQVKAPLVGTFYDSPSPDSKPFVTVNQHVNKGDILFILEAMKVMNEIKSPISGTIKKIHVNNGDMVEFSQVILEIEE